MFCNTPRPYENDRKFTDKRQPYRKRALNHSYIAPWDDITNSRPE